MINPDFAAGFDMKATNTKKSIKCLSLKGLEFVIEFLLQILGLNNFSKNIEFVLAPT